MGGSEGTTARFHAGAAVWLALWIVYIVWGSTYLAIRIGVAPTTGQGIPPLLLAGLRFTTPGIILLAVGLRQGTPDDRPDPVGIRQWIAGGIVGCALLLGGNGLVCVAERRIPSGTAALVIASVPILTTVIAAVIGRERFTARRGVGLAVGLAGVAVLTLGGAGSGDVVGILIGVAAALSWSLGSVYAGTAPLPRRPLVATGIELTVGGIGCLAMSAAIGEWSGFAPGAVPQRSWWALVYLAVAGSMVAYTAYSWLLSHAPLSLTTTYAYVNPVVAVILGAVILAEPLTARTVVAAALVVGGVMLVVTRRRPEPAGSVAAPVPESVELDREPCGTTVRQQ